MLTIGPMVRRETTLVAVNMLEDQGFYPWEENVMKFMDCMNKNMNGTR